ncbi:MAG: FAD-dependent oxidoreductase [Nitrososphaerota archaeon]|nr:FAD-dependent oxidoreductase [Nitrososphaerota archaeon]
MQRFNDPPSLRKGVKVSIVFCGIKVVGYTGEPISVSLYSQGIKALAKSKKLYRWRGFYSLSPQDRTILLKVGDEYVDPSGIFCREGQQVFSNLKTPLLVKISSPFLDGYFQHKKIFRNKLLWKLTVDKIKQFANIPDIRDVRTIKKGKMVNVESDVVVVGGGLAGLTAAYTVGKLGLRVVLVDDSTELGGRMRYDFMDLPGLNLPRASLMIKLVNDVGSVGVKILNKTIFAGFFEDYATAYSEEENTLYIFKAKAYILATGKVDLPCIFRGNDLPGVLSASTALEMMNWYKVKPGKKGVILGASEYGLRIAQQLKNSDIDVIILDSSKVSNIPSSLERIGEYIYNVREVEVLGDRSVEKVKIFHDGVVEVVDTDFIICSALSNPDLKIIGQLYSKTLFIDGVGFVPVHSKHMEVKDRVFVAGGSTGSPYGILHVIEGEIAGLAAASMCGVKGLEEELFEKVREYDKKLYEVGATWKEKIFKMFYGVSLEDLSTNISSTSSNIFLEKPSKDAFICFCEDITTKDLARTVFEKGYRILELVKRSSGICTGRCQGRLCMVNASLYISHLTNLDPNYIGLTRIRPPAIPLPLYALAGDEET